MAPEYPISTCSIPFPKSIGKYGLPEPRTAPTSPAPSVVCCAGGSAAMERLATAGAAAVAIKTDPKRRRVIRVSIKRGLSIPLQPITRQIPLALLFYRRVVTIAIAAKANHESVNRLSRAATMIVRLPSLTIWFAMTVAAVSIGLPSHASTEEPLGVAGHLFRRPPGWVDRRTSG